MGASSTPPYAGRARWPYICEAPQQGPTTSAQSRHADCRCSTVRAADCRAPFPPPSEEGCRTRFGTFARLRATLRAHACPTQTVRSRSKRCNLTCGHGECSAAVGWHDPMRVNAPRCACATRSHPGTAKHARGRCGKPDRGNIGTSSFLWGLPSEQNLLGSGTSLSSNLVGATNSFCYNWGSVASGAPLRAFRLGSVWACHALMPLRAAARANRRACLHRLLAQRSKQSENVGIA